MLADPPARVVLIDTPGEALVLTVYQAGGGAAAVVSLDPLRALALAADLTEAARRRLADGVAAGIAATAHRKAQEQP